MINDYKFCFRVENKMVPTFFLQFRSENNIPECQYETRQEGQLRLPRIRCEFARRSIAYRYTNIYNDMDVTIKSKIDTHSLDGFKAYLKRTTLDTYNFTCLNEGCPSC